MSLELLATIFKYAGYIGAGLVLVSTVGLGVVSGKLDQVKESIIGDLVSGKNSLTESVEAYKDQLEEKQKQIDELQIKSINASRNISGYYTFHGVFRKTNGAEITQVFGEQFEAFKKIVAFDEANDMESLKSLCTDEIAKTPEWLTPYYFRGLALFNLSEFELAKIDLQFVVSQSGDSPDYAQAKQWLNLIADRIAQRNR